MKAWLTAGAALALPLAACDRAPPAPSGNLTDAEEEARYQAVANEMAYEEQLRAAVLANAALRAEADNAALALQDEMVLNAAPVPSEDDLLANVAVPDDDPLAAPAPPSKESLKAADDAVRAAMERRRAAK